MKVTRAFGHLRLSGTRTLRALQHLGTWELRELRHLGTQALRHLGNQRELAGLNISTGRGQCQTKNQVMSDKACFITDTVVRREVKKK